MPCTDPIWLRALAPIRSIIGTVIMLIWTGVHSGILAFRLVSSAEPLKVGDWHIHFWARIMLRVFNITLQVEGAENLPKGGCVIVFNHTSNFDIPIAHLAIPKQFRFGSKIELFKIPIFGTMMRKTGCLPITRGDREKVLKLYKESVPRLHKGESFILAAEGTRTLTREIGNKFKVGPFIFAIAGQVPIVPVVFIGIFEIHPKKSLLPAFWRWSNPVKVKILPPVSTLGYSEDTREKLQDHVRALMTTAFYER